MLERMVFMEWLLRRSSRSCSRLASASRATRRRFIIRRDVLWYELSSFEECVLSLANTNERITCVQPALNFFFGRHFFKKKGLNVVRSRWIIVFHRHRCPEGIRDRRFEAPEVPGLSQRSNDCVLRDIKHLVFDAALLRLAKVGHGKMHGRATRQS